jgi:hypothetical protein
MTKGTGYVGERRLWWQLLGFSPTATCLYSKKKKKRERVGGHGGKPTAMNMRFTKQKNQTFITEDTDNFVR